MPDFRPKGEARQVFLMLRSGRSAELLQWLNRQLKSRQLVFRHPTLNRPVQCFAVGSRLVQDVNLVFFRSNEGHQWVWIQHYNLLDALYVDGELIILPTTEYGADMVTVVAAKIPSLLDQMPLAAVAFDGLLLSHSRPAHFLYDQLANLPLIGFDSKQAISEGPHVFFSAKYFVPPDVEVRVMVNDGCYLLPTLDLSHPVNPWLIESAVSRCTVALPSDTSCLRIWYGIASEKRRWTEQQQGIIKLTQELVSLGKQVEVVVDGFTSEVGRYIERPSDVAEFEAIRLKLNDVADVTSVISKDYEYKIAVAKSCDIFVTYAGTQSIVPVRIACLPGVIHSNSRYWVGRDQNEFTGVSSVPAEFIVDAKESTVKPDLVDYSIDPLMVVDMVMRLLKDEGKIT